jgi:uncharacterized protein involved in exopolysaccharide biosynthesis
VKAARREINYPLALWRRKWLILPFIVLGLVGAVAAFSQMTPLYRAQATVILIPQTISQEIYKGQWQPPKRRLKDIQQEVTSQAFRESVARALEIEDPTPQQLRRVTAGFRVIEIDPETFLFRKVGSNPQEAARRANAVATTFVEESRNRKIEQTAGSSLFLEDEIERLAVELQDEKDRLATYQAAHKGELPSDRDTHRAEQSFLRARVAELNARLESKQRDLEQRMALLNGESGDQETPLALDLPEDPRRERVREIEKELAEARLRYTDRHPQVVRLRASLESLLREIREMPYVPPEHLPAAPSGVNVAGGTSPDTGGNALERFLHLEISGINEDITELEAEKRTAETQIGQLEEQIQASYSHESEIGQIVASISLLETRLLQNQNRLQSLETEKEVFERGMDERYELKATAGVPLLPYQPDLLQLLIIGLVAGTAIGAGLALLRELMDRSVQSADDVENLLKAEILAIIPNMDKERRRGPRRPDAKGKGRKSRKVAHG